VLFPCSKQFSLSRGKLEFREVDRKQSGGLAPWRPHLPCGLRPVRPACVSMIVHRRHCPQLEQQRRLLSALLLVPFRRDLPLDRVRKHELGRLVVHDPAAVGKSDRSEASAMKQSHQ
jgi:hypothetical protein